MFAICFKLLLTFLGGWVVQAYGYYQTNRLVEFGIYDAGMRFCVQFMKIVLAILMLLCIWSY